MPAEIRNQIFTFALVHDEPLAMKAYFVNMRHGYRSYPSPPSLAQVSQQVRREAMSIFYGLNIFAFDTYAYRLYENKPHRPSPKNYSSSPFKWRLGLLTYDIEVPRHVRNLSMNPDTPEGGLSMTFTQDNNGDILITAHLTDSTSSFRELCMCKFEELAADVIGHWDMYGEDQLFRIAETFQRVSHRKGLLCWREDGECPTCRNEKVKTASYRVPGSASV